MGPAGQLRILVVDDNDAGRYAVGRVLQRAGFAVTEAGTGGDALARLAQEHPDLVLLDTRLPDVSGTEVCRRIKSSPETASTLVLQTSASAVDDGSRVAALEGGADGYINSPVEPPVLVATVRSLLRIRSAERALQEALEEWKATFDAISDGVALLDAGGVVRRSNAALPELLQCESGEIAGRNLDDVIPPTPGDSSLHQALQTGRTTMERALGERTFSLTLHPMADAENRPSGAVAVISDISERRLLDEQLRHSQKLESIGLLAGGVAHDFNNLLVGILGNASLAIQVADDPAKTRQLLGDMVRAGERAAELTRQLLAYAGKGRFFVSPVDISSLIRELVPLIQASIPRKVRFKLEVDPKLPAIQADKTQIEQLVMNLLINAGEAIADDGEITITTALRHVEAGELGGFLTEQEQGGYFVALRVCDTGHGMDQETLKRIFDPFFSTKFLGRGLGLSAALGIIRGHKGALKVTSVLGQGTVFEVLFPVTGEIQRPAPISHDPALVSGYGTVLMVDDEDLVRSLVQRTLTHAGYQVLLAEDGAEAMSVFARHAQEISVVVLDLVMPVMSGEETLRRLLAVRPDLPVIVSSGQDQEVCQRQLQEPRIAGFLQKPYTAPALTAKVKEVLRLTPNGVGRGIPV